jgi:LPS export ABC transporter permease LptG/LPS export ABC transporter permease LptF
MFRILDRYTLREILPPFMLALLVFTFMLMMGPIDKVAKDLLSKNVEAGIILRMLFLLTPSTLAITIPMAFLLGLLVAFGRLSADSEWVAMQACGVTLLRMLRPVMALAIACWAATSWVMIDAVPSANQAYREITYGVIAARVESEIKPRIFFTDFPTLVLFARDTAPGGGGWSDVFVADVGAPGPPLISMARGGRMLLNRERRQVEMVLDDRVSYRMGTDAKGAAFFEESFSKQFRTQLDPEQVFPKAMPVKGEPEKTVAELRQTIVDLKKDKQPTDRPEFYIQLKFSIPVACLVFALMGLGFGVSSSRGGKLAAFAMGTGVIFAYYVILYQGRSLSMSGVWPAWLAAWLPNMILGPVGAWVVYRRARSSGSSLQIAVPAVGFLRRLVPTRQAPGTTAGPASAPSGPVLVIRFPQFWLPRPPRLGILDRYISRMYLRLQVLTFVSLLGIFYISQFIDLSDKLFGGVTTANLMLQFFIFKTPQFIYYIIPLSVLIATLVTVGALTRNSELIVMRACGISLYRAAYPLVALAACSSLLLFGIEEYALAASNDQARDLEHIIRIGRPRPSSILARRWIAAKDGSIYHYDMFDAKHGELVGFWKYEFDQKTWQLNRIVFAERIRFERPAATPGSPVGTWTAGPGWVRGIRSESESPYAPFSSRALTMELPEYFGAAQPDAASMTYAELSDYIDAMRGAGHNILQYLVELHRKIAFPFVTIIMTLLAVPFAVTTGRRGALYGIGVGIVLAIVYWTANNLFAVVGSTGLLAPVLAAWAPNLLFGAGAAYLVLTVRT